MSKPKTRKELLKWLAFWTKNNILPLTPKEEQAYNQIREIIQNQPEVPEEQYMEIVMDLYKRIGKLEKKKLEISMKDIRGWADSIQENIKDHEDWSYLPDGIKEMIEGEFGVKVKK